MIKFGAFELHLENYELRENGVPIPTEPQVFSLIHFLVR